MKLKFICLAFFLFALFAFRQKQITWVAIGDSITYLNDHPDETGNRVQKGYLTRVKESLPQVSFVNKGFNGWKTSDVAARFSKLAIPAADVYSLFLGTNDWWSGRPVGDLNDYKNNNGNGSVCGSIRTIIDGLRAIKPAAKFILVTPLKRGDFVYIADQHNNAYGSYKPKNGQTLQQVADAIKAIGKYEGFEVIDLYNNKAVNYGNIVKFKRVKVAGVYKNLKYPAYTNKPFDPSDVSPSPVQAMDMTYDGLHPSDKGNAVIAASFIRVFKRMF